MFTSWGSGLGDVGFRFMVVLAGWCLCLSFIGVLLMLCAWCLLWLGGWDSICKVVFWLGCLLDVCYLLLNSCFLCSFCLFTGVLCLFWFGLWCFVCELAGGS